MKRGICVRLFDLHCDTLGLGWEKGEKIGENSGAVSLEKGKRYAAWIQVFAAFLPDDAPCPARLCAGLLDTALRWEEEEPERFRLFRGAPPVDFSGCLGILSVENGGRLAALEDPIGDLAARGVKMLSLTWNGDNPWGSGCFGCPERGLTPAGRAALCRMKDCGMLPDVSHLNERGFDDLAAVWSGPFVASHSNSRAVCDHPRNLTDRQFRCIRERGGLVGLNFYAPHLGGATLAAFEGHLRHFLRLGGEECLCIGSDLDGMPPPAMGGPEQVFDGLRKMGYSAETLNNVFFENARRFFAAWEDEKSTEKEGFV